MPVLGKPLALLAFIEGHRDQAREHYDRAREILNPASAMKLSKKTSPVFSLSAPPSIGQTNKPISVGSSEVVRNEVRCGTTLFDSGYGGGESISEKSADLPVEFERPTVKFADVGGMNAVKEEIQMKIVFPLKNPDLFRQYGKKPGGGVLLYGPPGCGKTLLSRATAGEIKATFLSIGIHQVLDMWLGNSEKNLHKIFELARQNTPAILFFDEVDALASDRALMKQSAGRNVINQFLAEMDGAPRVSKVSSFLGATNAPWQVDSAFAVPGDSIASSLCLHRMRRLAFRLSNSMSVGKPLHKLDARALAKRTKDFSGADLKAVFDVASEEKLAIAMRENRVVPISTDDLIRAAKSMQPSTKAWFESAKNYALYANQAGFYNDVLAFLGIKK